MSAAERRNDRRRLVDSLHNGASGFSLIELLIGAAAGLLVVSGAVTLLVAVLRSNNDTIKSTRLQQDLNAIVAIMGNEIRRAGYNGQLDVPLSDDASLGAANSCLHYSYAVDGNNADDDGDGETDEDDELKRHGGFKLSSDGDQIQMYKASSIGFSCSAPGPGNYWEGLNDDREIEVTDFNVVDSSRCLNGDGNLIECDDAGALVRVRQLELSLSGELKSDPSVHMTVQGSIRLRNDVRLRP